MQSRSVARRRALQALYQWQISGEELSEIERQFREEHGLDEAQEALFCALLHGVPAHVGQLDALIGAHADRPVESIDPVERAILRMGVYELLHHPDVPCRVVLNESINLAKAFGATHSHRYVNGILDKIARVQRRAELQGGDEPPPAVPGS